MIAESSPRDRFVTRVFDSDADQTDTDASFAFLRCSRDRRHHMRVVVLSATYVVAFGIGGVRASLRETG